MTCNRFSFCPKIVLEKKAIGASIREEIARKGSNMYRVIKLEPSCTINRRMEGIVPEIPVATASVSLVSLVIRSPVWYLLTESQSERKIFSYTFLRIPNENFSLITIDIREVRIVMACDSINNTINSKMA